jgi:hypothetical protein
VSIIIRELFLAVTVHIAVETAQISKFNFALLKSLHSV